MAKNLSDPLRIYLQQAWVTVCDCDYCHEVALKWLASPRSPIETMMSNAFAWSRHVVHDNPAWQLHHQWPVLDYTADFALLTPEAKIVVECDGHDFHERTKEQARHDRSRDRAMQEAGWLVLRFTGSEIWSNPLACADQVIELARDHEIRAAEAAHRRGE